MPERDRVAGSVFGSKLRAEAEQHGSGERVQAAPDVSPTEHVLRSVDAQDDEQAPAGTK